MEKRLFLALILSFLVLYMFQGTRTPRNVTEVPVTQDVAEIPQNSPSRSSIKSPSKSFEETFHNISGSNLLLLTSNRGGMLHTVRTHLHDYVFPVSQVVSVQGFEEFPFAVQDKGSQFVTYEFSDGTWRIRKHYELGEDFLIKASVELHNISDAPQTMSVAVNAFSIDAGKESELSAQERTLFEYSALVDGKVIRKANAQKISAKSSLDMQGSVEWEGFRDRYFALIVDPFTVQERYVVSPEGEAKLDVGFGSEAVSLSAGEGKTWDFQIYAGPQDLDALGSAEESYEKIFVFSNWGIMDAIAKAIHQFIRIVHKVLPNWGLAIIVTAVIIYFAIYPLTAKSMASMKRMQSLQPMMAELKVKHKDSPERLNKEMMELYRREKVNPLGGCLPMLLQMPIFIGLYQVLWRSVYLKGASFLWIKDLSEPDRLIYPLPFTMPFLGDAFNLLPVLMMFVMMVQQRLSAKNMGTPSDPAQATQQKMMQTIFPVFLGVIFYKFASGLTLYFTVFYLLTTLTQWKMSKAKVVSKP